MHKLVHLESAVEVNGVVFELRILEVLGISGLLNDCSEEVLDHIVFFVQLFFSLDWLFGDEVGGLEVCHVIHLLLGGHFLQMVVEDGVVFVGLYKLNVLIQQWFELLNEVNVHLEMHKAVQEQGLAVGELKVKGRVVEGDSLNGQNFLDHLLVRKRLILLSSILFGEVRCRLLVTWQALFALFLSASFVSDIGVGAVALRPLSGLLLVLKLSRELVLEDGGIELIYLED